MALTLTSEVETHLATGHVEWSPLVRIDFGFGTIRRWSDRHIPASKSFDGEEYEARLAPIPALEFDLSSDDQIQIQIENATGYARGLIDKGFRFHRARVSVCVLYHGISAPNNVVGDWTNPYWQGSVVKGPKLRPDWCTLGVAGGFLELSRKHPRFQHSCQNLYADGLFCDSKPLEGKGLPERRFDGTATGGSATTLVDSGADFSAAQKGWLVFNGTDQSIGVVTNVATTTLTVDFFRNGSANAFSASDTYLVGPEFTHCPGSKSACIQRDMFALAPFGSGNTVRRRWFRGLSTLATVPFLTRGTDFSGDDGYFNRTAESNRGLDGEAIPYVFGCYRNRSMRLLGIAVEDENQDHPFINALWFVSAGRVFSVQGIDIDGWGIDNVDPRGDPEKKDSLVVFTFHAQSGANDSSDIGTELTTEQQRLGIGSRESRAMVRGVNLDTYASNPYLFNGSDGDGISFANGTYIRTRHQPNGVNRSPKGSAQLIGQLTAMPTGSTAQVDDGNVTDWTKFPNPVQVLYHYLRYVGGFAEARLDLPSFITASDYCQAQVSSSQAHLSNVTGTVAFGPDDAGTSTSLKNFFHTTDELSRGLAGGTVTVQTSGGATTRVVSAIIPITRSGIDDFDPETGGGPFDIPVGNQGERQWKVLVTEDFESGKIPAAGDTFTIFAAGSSGASVRRYKFNGNVEDKKPVGENAAAILENCGGKLTLKNGKIGVEIPQAVNLTTVEADTIFADSGANRNIVHQDGLTTVEWDADPWEDVANSITVEFADRDLDYQVVGREVYNRSAQKYVADAFGETAGREKADKKLSLNGTHTADQALRLAAIKLRTQGPLPGNRQNGTCRFVLPLHEAQKLEVWADVHLIESNELPQYLRGIPFRLVGMKMDLDGCTAETEWRPHLNSFYDDTADDHGMERLPVNEEIPIDQLPYQTEILNLTDVGFNTGDGTRQERVRVRSTLPTLP